MVRNDAVNLVGIRELAPDGILLSPGPCTPRESGVCLDVVGAALAQRPGFHDAPFSGCASGIRRSGR